MISRLICFFLLMLSVHYSPVHASLEPKHYDLNCGEHFDCPQALHRRIHFWIEIFGRHGTESAVLHDRDQPEKVYSVVRSPNGCGGRKAPKAVERERTKIKQSLVSLANKRSKRQKLTHQEQQLSSLFKNQSISEIRQASSRIRCQSGNATRFQHALKRFGAHQPIISQALETYGLPQGIQYLPFVESAYSATNYSSVGAAGLWQLMPRTATHLGLLVNPVIDERYDPEISTLGAIRYLQHSFEVLAPAARRIDANVSLAEIYPFVMTSYNFGLSGMLKAMNEVGVNFVDVLDKYQSNNFQVAVKNFYASFLAARHVATHHEQFFSSIDKNKPADTVSAINNKPRQAKKIARHFGISIDQLKHHNPALKPGVWKGRHLVPEGFKLQIPATTSYQLKTKIAALNLLSADKPPRVQRRYRVRRGDTACGIAHRFKVNCRQLIRNNNLGKRAIVRVGKHITLPGGSVILKHPVTSAESRIFRGKIFSASAIMQQPVTPAQRKPSSYTVASGDTLCGIARQFHIRCKELKTANGIRNSALIVKGQTLTIPGKQLSLAKKSRHVYFSGNQSAQLSNTDDQSTDTQLIPDQGYLAEIHSYSYLDQYLSSNFSLQENTESGLRVTENQRSQLNQQQPLHIATANTKQQPVKTAQNQVKAIAKALPKKNIRSARHKTVHQPKVASDATKKLKNSKASSTKKSHTVQPGPDTKIKALLASGDLRVTQQGNHWIIQVATDETLGHYADWLNIGFSKPILKLNGIKSSRSVRIGKTIRLPIKDQATKKRFEQKRLAYHHNLQQRYFNRYAITGKKQYRFQSGDNPWTIATAHQIPLWLLKRYNPDIFKSQHDIGNVVILPILQAQQS